MPTAPAPSDLTAIVPPLPGDRLTLADFSGLATTVAGYPYVKLVLDQETSTVHLIDGAERMLHVQYVAERILGMTRAELARNLDAFNDSVYRADDRRFLLGTLALHDRPEYGGLFVSLETVEVDTMGPDLLRSFYRTVRTLVDDAVPVLLKPANHLQESFLRESAEQLPLILAHELYSTAPYVPLNPGTTIGRLRVFADEAAYRTTTDPVRWHDILVMERMPDDIPRLSGLINARHTTPLSHTNVLAAGWGIPNAIQQGALTNLAELDGDWVEVTVDQAAPELAVRTVSRPDSIDDGPPWATTQVDIGKPDLAAAQILPLEHLRSTDAHRFGTKAANLGELTAVLRDGSPYWLGFYQAPRPPRPHLLEYLARQLETTGTDAGVLDQAAQRMVTEHAVVPRGIALPFALQQQFLESSPAIQQTIGKLKMALALGGEIDGLCAELGGLIRDTPLPAELRTLIEDSVLRHLTGAGRVVVRSSSNAEDLIGFSAAGIYESVPEVKSIEDVIHAIQRVWASLVTTRGVLLRDEAGIGLSDCFMGVVIQQQLDGELGGVMVTTNPLDRTDFRSVLLNLARNSVDDVVSGTRDPLQHLYNTMEGGSRTVAMGAEPSDVDDQAKATLGRLALIGRLLQAHFAGADGSVDAPVDVEWLVDGDRIVLLQCRPYQLAA
ncbi:PEP/pyruvate-binding domain-containing protein [Streptomyces sp. SID13031]|uniref:PEP/pyruvate-binding domain-containing protein n=1 Tax=Streptomyces sp. SID13031 TaxID=2706046 RepID=UPI0013CD2A32|nr:phosphoenolpyruvate synthase [Streptomyces sp. SID13031]